jgi:hypothetical protein
MRGEIREPAKDVFSMHSDKLIEALLKMSNFDDSREKNFVLARTLMPSIINDLVKRVIN